MFKQFVLIISTIYGIVGIILGAFGAHLFKKYLTIDKLQSFEVGIKYQLYHAILLLVLGLYFSFNSHFEKSFALFIIIGTFLFSVSIYFLSFADFWKINLKFLGPITPLGGLFIIIGWSLLLYYFIFKIKLI